MCLHSHVSTPMIAEEDIMCYKFLKCDYLHKRVVTPYKDIEIPIFPYTMNAEGKEEIRVDNIYSLYPHNYLIGAGYIHSSIYPFPIIGRTNVIIVKAKIPKGTKYYEGIYNDLCSKKLELIRILPKKEIRKVLVGYIDDFDKYILPLLYDKDEIQFRSQTIPF